MLSIAPRSNSLLEGRSSTQRTQFCQHSGTPGRPRAAFITPATFFAVFLATRSSLSAAGTSSSYFVLAAAKETAPAISS